MKTPLSILLVFFGFWFLVFGFFLRSPSVNAQKESSSASSISAVTDAGCNEAFRTQLTLQQFVLRQIWFGRKDAEQETVNAVREDDEGDIWMKTGENIWRTSTKGFENTTWTNAQMNGQTAWEGMNETTLVGKRSERTGIFEQKGMLTSELLPDLLQSFRAFQCRTAMVCEAVEQSFLRGKTDDGGFLHIATPGCEEMIMKPLAQCRFGNADAKEAMDLQNPLTGFSTTVVHTECQPLAEQLIAREASFLRTAVAYDAAIRTLLQFGGSFDAFIEGLRGDVLAPLEQTMSLLSQLSRIPCFAAQCNE